MSSSTVAALELVLQREQAPAMEELRREMERARMTVEDLGARLDARERLLEIARANSFYTNSLRFNREIRLAREGDRLSRWSVERSLEEGVPVPMEVWRAVRLMRQYFDEADDEADGEADDDAEMAVDSTAAVP